MGCTHSKPRGPRSRSQSAHPTTPSNSHQFANQFANHNTNPHRRDQQQRPHTPTPPPKHAHFRLHHPSRLLHSLSTLSLSNAAYAAAVFGGSPGGSETCRPVRVGGEESNVAAAAVDKGQCRKKERGDGRDVQGRRSVQHMASLKSLRSLRSLKSLKSLKKEKGKGKDKGRDREEREDVEKDKEVRDKEKEKKKEEERVGLPRRSTLPSLVTHRQVSRVDLRRRYKCQERRSMVREKEEKERERERDREEEELCIREE